VRLLIDTLTGLCDLARLALISRLNFKGPYWRWRLHTAFGRGHPPRPEMTRGILDYARWIRRMRRLM
jgi:hypothetical protein